MEIPVKFLIGFDLFFMVGDGRTNRGGGQGRFPTRFAIGILTPASGLDLTCALDWDSLVDATPPSFSWADRKSVV